MPLFINLPLSSRAEFGESVAPSLLVRDISEKFLDSHDSVGNSLFWHIFSLLRRLERHKDDLLDLNDGDCHELGFSAEYLQAYGGLNDIHTSL